MVVKATAQVIFPVDEESDEDFLQNLQDVSESKSTSSSADIAVIDKPRHC
jgi:hypothetical protein